MPMPKGSPNTLTARQRCFCDNFRGNASEAARAAGVRTELAAQQGYRWLTTPHVKAEIDRQASARTVRAVKTRDELQRFWSEIIDDPMAPLRDRMRASELLGKSRGEFSEKLEVKGELQLTDLVRESMGPRPK